MNCDAIAPYYAALEFAVFGRALERCRSHFLPEAAHARRALVLGDGDGRFLRELRSRYPALETDYVDRSRTMLSLARRAAGDRQIHYWCRNLPQDPVPCGPHDLVTAHFFFDCFDAAALAEIVERVRETSPSARWVVSEFAVPESKWLARPAQVLIATMYAFFGLATGLRTRSLTDHRPVLEKAGLVRAKRVAHARGLLVSELWTPPA